MVAIWKLENALKNQEMTRFPNGFLILKEDKKTYLQFQYNFTIRKTALASSTEVEKTQTPR